MNKIQVDYQGPALNFQSASLLAKDTARANQMKEPTIMAWHQNGNENMTPFFDGADPDTWWAKYGAGNGGRLEICLGDEFQFIMMDSRGYEELGEMPLRNMTDAHGNHFLCHTPMLGKVSGKPTADACTPLDGWAADQY